jgi:arsenate reductase (glutaredoxin)
MLKIYHNPRCAKSRKGLDYLSGKGMEFEVINYMQEGLRAEEVREIFLKSNVKPSLLARTQDDYYKMYLKGKNFSDDEWVQIYVEHPAILQRPIVVGRYKAVLAIPPENMDVLFK